jgi:hypothetical protein
MKQADITPEALRAAHDDYVQRLGKSHAITALATDYGIPDRKLRRWLIDAGIRKVRDAVIQPPLEELTGAYETAIAEHGPRASVTALATAYKANPVTIRKWLDETGLRAMGTRIPPRPITEPCPCGAVATTRYKGQDPPLCFKCYMRTWAADPDSPVHRRGREYIAQVKQDAACADCGGKFPPACMHFDHVPERGPKLFNLGNGDYSIEAIEAEIAKCDIVCANCHAVRTWTTRQQPWVRRGPVLQEQAPTGTDGVLF